MGEGGGGGFKRFYSGFLCNEKFPEKLVIYFADDTDILIKNKYEALEQQQHTFSAMAYQLTV